MRMLLRAIALMAGLSVSALAQNTRQVSQPMIVNFTLIRADNSGRTDPSLGGLDSTLRGVLRFTGYRGVAYGGSRAQPGNTFDLTLPVESMKKTVRVFCTVECLNAEGSAVAAQLRIKLASVDSTNTSRVLDPPILSAGLTIPENQKVVVGSGSYDDGGLALVVTWKRGVFGQKP